MRHLIFTIAGLLFLFYCYAGGRHNTGNKTTYSNHPFNTIDVFNPNDSIGFSGSAAICAGKSLLLTANYAPTGSTFQWRVSTDGGTTWMDIANATNKTYSATTTGLYRVDVTTNGVTTIYPAVNVTVNAYPVADFTFSPNNACSSLPISFTNTTPGTGNNFLWIFGDPLSGVKDTSTAKDAIHHFIGNAVGGMQTFTTSLIVTNSSGCKDTIKKIITTQSPGTILNGPNVTTYNGLNYFTQCSQLTTATLTFFNASVNNPAPTSFRIIWGDNTPDFSATTFPGNTPVPHTYGLGTFDLQFIVAGANGCVDTAFYHVFIGSNPAVSLGIPANTTICGGDSLTFPIPPASGNPFGTLYTVRFNDGSLP